MWDSDVFKDVSNALTLRQSLEEINVRNTAVVKKGDAELDVTSLYGSQGSAHGSAITRGGGQEKASQTPDSSSDASDTTAGSEKRFVSLLSPILQRLMAQGMLIDILLWAFLLLLMSSLILIVVLAS